MRFGRSVQSSLRFVQRLLDKPDDEVTLGYLLSEAGSLPVSYTHLDVYKRQVLFSAHAGGGFATGNQANTYYVGLGWAGPVSAVIAMLLLTLTMRQAMVMYNSRGLTSYKQLFQVLYHPFDKIEWLFEVFFYIMVLMAVAAAISGAASALQGYFGVNYYLAIVLVGIVVLTLTIFGAGIVRAASTYMGIAILAVSYTHLDVYKRQGYRRARYDPCTGRSPRHR